jgi:enoyl-CoA hydratase
MKTSAAELRVEEENGVLIITIDRPEQRNAMTFAIAKAIALALDELDNRKDLSVGILSGSGGNFCSGMDLKRFVEGELASVSGRGFGGVTERPPRKPLIAAVEGYALAGGFEMVLACDMVIASTDATFGLPEVRRGLVARAGGLLRLPLLIPQAVAMELILTGNTFGAARAESLGLVNKVVPVGETLTTAKILARTIAANAPLAIEAAKRIVIESPTWPPDQKFSIQKEISDPVFSSDDAKEGALAFAERRIPVWTGS